ncbi:MAG: hypothetical protein R3F43_32040 [bacterium]
MEIAPPTAAADEVEIRVRAFGLNRAEGYYRGGQYGTLVPGQALGIEAVGEVIRDPAAGSPPASRSPRPWGGMFTRHGGYAEHIAVKADNVVTIDADLPAQRLAGLPEAYLTIWGALDKNLGIQAGRTLLVRGATLGPRRPRRGGLCEGRGLTVYRHDPRRGEGRWCARRAPNPWSSMTAASARPGARPRPRWRRRRPGRSSAPRP